MLGEVPGGEGGEGPPLGCDGLLEVTVDESGAASGEGLCSFMPFGEVPVLLEGTVDGDGQLEAVLTIDAEVELFEVEVDAVASSDTHIEGQLAGDVELQGGPAAGALVSLEGELALDR